VNKRNLKSLLIYYWQAARMHAIQALMQFHRPKKPRIVVLDPALKDFHGHHAEFARILLTELGTKYDVQICCNFRAQNIIVYQLRAQPIFYDSIYNLETIDDLNTFLAAKTRYFFEAIQRIRPTEVDSRTVILMHTLTIFQLGGLYQWLRTLPATQRPKIFLQFQYPLEYRVNPASLAPRAVAFVRRVIADLMALTTVVLSSNSRTLAARISKQLGQPCSTMPLPVRWPETEKPARLRRGVTFGFFGSLRSEKGSKLMAEVLPRFTAQFSDARFLVQAPPLESDGAAVKAIANLSAVELIRTNFAGKEEYFDRFLEADCILLPYDPSTYEVRTSSIFIEAMGLGIPIIVTRRTWMENELGENTKNVFFMDDFTTESLYTALVTSRNALLTGTGHIAPNQQVIYTNSQAGFCRTIIALLAGDNTRPFT
jgi:glycosyltransferase involved in cell wall biosynthesis